MVIIIQHTFFIGCGRRNFDRFAFVNLLGFWGVETGRDLVTIGNRYLWLLIVTLSNGKLVTN